MLWIHFLLPFMATISYGILFQVPKKALLGGGLIGMSGWVIVYTLTQYAEMPRIIVVLFAAFLVGTISQLISIKLKMPSINFSVAGIIPLVPGIMAYRTMTSFVQGEYIEAMALGTETMLIAGAIASGLMFSLSIFFVGKGKGWRDGARDS